MNRSDINLKSKNVTIVSEKEFQEQYRKCDNRTALDAGMAIVALPIICGVAACIYNIVVGKDI